MRTATRPRLLSPYPGAKNPDRYPVHDGGDYDCWIAPFAGSGEQESWVAQRYPRLPVVAADSDPLVRSVWHCWGSEAAMNAVNEALKVYCAKVKADPEKGFDWLAERMQQRLSRYPSIFIDLAAASILLRRLTFGGVIRRNNDGVLNVGLSQDKLQTFLAGWEFQWPEPPQSLAVFDDYSKATPQGGSTRAIALIDPPYCAGTTDAYAHADGPLEMALDCLEGLLASGNVARIVAFNYWGEWVEGEDSPTEYPICEAMQQLAAKYGTEAHFSHLGALATMNKGAGKGAVHRYEGVWELGGRRLYGSRPLIKPGRDRIEQMALSF